MSNGLYEVLAECEALRAALELLIDAVETGDGLQVVTALEHARAALREADDE